MAIWDRFRRNREQSVLPDEVNKYYQPENQGNRARALLLGFITLVVTLVIVALLFFGGRAIYRHFSKKSTPAVVKTTPSTSEQNTGNSSNSDNGSSQSNTNNQSNPTGSSNAGSTTPAPSTNGTSGTNGSSGMPFTGDDQTSLPATGSPEGM
jgi:cytoskeletal protein RodZ